MWHQVKLQINILLVLVVLRILPFFNLVCVSFLAGTDLPDTFLWLARLKTRPDGRAHIWGAHELVFQQLPDTLHRIFSKIVLKNQCFANVTRWRGRKSSFLDPPPTQDGAQLKFLTSHIIIIIEALSFETCLFLTHLLSSWDVKKRAIKWTFFWMGPGHYRDLGLRNEPRVRYTTTVLYYARLEQTAESESSNWRQKKLAEFRGGIRSSINSRQRLLGKSEGEDKVA